MGTSSSSSFTAAGDAAAATTVCLQRLVELGHMPLFWAVWHPVSFSDVVAEPLRFDKSRVKKVFSQVSDLKESAFLARLCLCVGVDKRAEVICLYRVTLPPSCVGRAKAIGSNGS